MHIRRVLTTELHFQSSPHYLFHFILHFTCLLEAGSNCVVQSGLELTMYTKHDPLAFLSGVLGSPVPLQPAHITILSLFSTGSCGAQFLPEFSMQPRTPLDLFLSFFPLFFKGWDYMYTVTIHGPLAFSSSFTSFSFSSLRDGLKKPRLASHHHCTVVCVCVNV